MCVPSHGDRRGEDKEIRRGPARSKDESGNPTPDRAIEVDISRPEVDRPGIYAASGAQDAGVPTRTFPSPNGTIPVAGTQ
jgi:hypothetical protein